ncbi:MAG: molybdenum cofactor guanylyltransferase [Spirochaetales bacterium]|nr:molybdenum cofactor guanylyltransferase [Spirochaetales bacterium]
MKKTEDLTVGIAAGGKSSRFGSDKRYARFEGKSFLDNLIDKYSSFPELILSVDSILESYSQYRQVVDGIRGIGPIEAIHQILVASRTEYAFIIAVDMPLAGREIADILAKRIDDNIDCICPVSDGHKQPLCAIYSKKIIPCVEKMISVGNYRLRDLLDSITTEYVDLPPDCFLNINTPEDYMKVNR